MSDITIIIVNYKSTQKTIDFLKKIPVGYNIIIVDNSNDGDLRKTNLENDKIKIVETENNGYGSAINRGRREIKTNYFFAFSPDIQGVDKNFFEGFEELLKTDLKFAAVGPRFTQVTHKSHKQSDEKKQIGKINAISGAALLLKTDAFDKINGFDEKIFLFFEENDLCARLIKQNFNIYQLNKIKVFHPKGVEKGTVEVDNNKYSTLQNFYGWHYMWSKFYHYKKNKFYFFSYIFFIPTILRFILRIIFHGVIQDHNNKNKYLMRLNGLLSSMTNIPSNKRINL